MAGDFAVYNFGVDWNADGDYSDTGESLSGEFKKIVVEYGRDDNLGKAQVGRARVVARDISGSYVLGNLSSVIVNTFGGIFPGRPVKIEAKHGASSYDLWHGKLDDVVAEPAKNIKEATFLCTDGFTQLKKATIGTSIHQSSFSGGTSGMVQLALIQAGWPSGQWIISSNEIDAYPQIFAADGVKALDFIQKIEQSEFGLFLIGNDGLANWEDRHTRLKLVRSTSSNYTLTAGEYTKIEPTGSLKNIVNKVILRAQPKTIAGSLSEIASWHETGATEDAPAIAPGETKTFWMQFRDSDRNPNIAANVQRIEAASGDIVGNSQADAGGITLTANISAISTVFADEVKAQVTNGGVEITHMTTLRVRGKIYTNKTPVKILSEDASSELAYGENEIDVSLPYYQNSQVMQGNADLIVASRKEPIEQYKIELLNRTSSELHQILSRRISDRITLNTTDFNISGDFYIEKIRHEIDKQGRRHRCWWTVNKADSDAYWILDESQLEGDANFPTAFRLPTVVGF